MKKSYEKKEFQKHLSTSFSLPADLHDKLTGYNRSELVADLLKEFFLKKELLELESLNENEISDAQQKRLNELSNELELETILKKAV